jgi:hypothetical protein
MTENTDPTTPDEVALNSDLEAAQPDGSEDVAQADSVEEAADAEDGGEPAQSDNAAEAQAGDAATEASDEAQTEVAALDAPEQE